MQGGGAGRQPAAEQHRLITWRVLVFVVVLLGVLGAAALIVARADPAWSVAVDKNDVVVKQGDKIQRRTPLRADQLPPDARNKLEGSGHKVKDQAEAERYVLNLGVDAANAGKVPLQGAGTIETSVPTSSTAAPVPGP